MSNFFNDPNANFALDMMMVDELSKDEEENRKETPPPRPLTKTEKIVVGVIGGIIGAVIAVISALH